MSGLDYAWNRYYSATWGRFTSADPYVMSGGMTTPQGWNRYSYVENDPVNFLDSRGLEKTGIYTYWNPPSTPKKGVDPPSFMFLNNGGIPIVERDDPTREDSGIGVNPGNDPALLLSKSLKAALNALQDAGCAGLFNSDSSRPHTYGPGIVLQAMMLDIDLAGVRFGSVKTGNIRLDAAAITVPINGITTGGGVRALTADIILQNNPLGARYTEYSAIELAGVLLHELGHVFDIVTTLGGSAIRLDANSDGSPNDKIQQENSNKLSNCKPRL